MSDSETDDALAIAINLGWRMAELWSGFPDEDLAPPTPPGTAPQVQMPDPVMKRQELPRDLPGSSRLGRAVQFELGLTRILAGAALLGPKLQLAGLSLPDTSMWIPLARQRKLPEARYQLSQCVRGFHDSLLTQLTAADSRLGTAYGLGRALADLTLRPDKTTQKSLSDDFVGGRVTSICGWLRELSDSLPEHSSGAVVASVAQWEKWATAPTWNGDTLDWSTKSSVVIEALRDQGERWRKVLTGEVAPLALLTAEDFVEAAGFLVGRTKRIAARAVVQYWPWVIGLVIATAAAIAISLFGLSSSAERGIGVAVSLLASLGISGKVITSAVGHVVTQAEHSLWGAELDLAAGRSLTDIPGRAADIRLGEPLSPADWMLRRLRNRGAKAPVASH